MQLNHKYLRRILSKNDRIICERLNIHNIYHLVFIQTKITEKFILTEKEYKNYLFENSTNAYELITLYKEYRIESENFYSKESVINEYFHSIKREDFLRYSDKNHITKKLKRWFNPKSESLDTKLEELNTTYHTNIEIQDVIDFILNHQPGEFRNEYQIKMKEINFKFKSIFGFNIKDYYVEYLLKIIEDINYQPEEICPF